MKQSRHIKKYPKTIELEKRIDRLFAEEPRDCVICGRPVPEEHLKSRRRILCGDPICAKAREKVRKKERILLYEKIKRETAGVIIHTVNDCRRYKCDFYNERRIKQWRFKACRAGCAGKPIYYPKEGD